MSSDSSNVLDQAIAQISDETVRARVAREVELLRGSRRFGLVFDRHLPESVRLPNHPIRKGVRVGLRDESSDETWRVVRFTDSSRQVASLDDGKGDVPVKDLVAVREFGEPVFPGLRSVERIEHGPVDAPWHTVINGENFHALQALRSTHLGKVDLIYIDPPYNTGNEGWIYNDRYVADQDRAKSSKWLSFMERRLLIARDLLRQTGVIIVAIGDDEHHRLRMLLDQVFGGQNFLSDVVWQGGTKSYQRYVSNVSDYMLIYAKSESDLASADIQWRETKVGVEAAIDMGKTLLDQSGGDAKAATTALRKWFRTAPASLRAAGVNRYDNVEDVTGRLFSADGDMGAPEERPNRSRKVLIHPITGKPCPVPPRGWRWSDEELDRRLAERLIAFGPDEKKIPRSKRYLDEMDSRVVDNVFTQDRNKAGTYLSRILGDKRFPYPKDHEVLMRWIRLAAPKDATILDFFGGSGTSVEAVMRLNEEDGGTRQGILVTNNEVGAKQASSLRTDNKHPGDSEWEAAGVFEHVTRPRVSTVVTGERPDGSTYSEGLTANVEMFELAYLDPGSVRRGNEFSAIAPLLWLEAGAVGARIDEVPTSEWDLTETYGVLFSSDAFTPFAEAVTAAAAGGNPPTHAFIITDSPTEFQTAAERLPVGIEAVRLYTDYLSNYTINTESSTR